MKDRREKSVAKWALRVCNKIITFVTHTESRERDRLRQRETEREETGRETHRHTDRECRESTEKRKSFIYEDKHERARARETERNRQKQ